MPRGLSLLHGLLLLAAACGHAPRAAPREEAAVWPAPPAAPRARLAWIFPDPTRPPPRPNLLRRLVDLVAGRDPDGPAPRPLERPFGVAVDGEAVFVADPELPAVLRISPDGAHSRVECAGVPWVAPMGVALGPGASILVADAGAGRLVRVERDRRCTPLAEGELERPTGVAARGDRIYVVDPPRHALVVLDDSGRVLSRLGGRGSDAGQLHFPSAVAVSPSGTVLVADAFNFGVAIWDADGAWRGRIAGGGEEELAPPRPKGIAADGAGRIYLSDAERDEVAIIGPDGAREFAIGATGAEPGRLAHPAGLALAGDRLVVADSLNRRIQSFELLGGHP